MTDTKSTPDSNLLFLTPAQAAAMAAEQQAAAPADFIPIEESEVGMMLQGMAEVQAIAARLGGCQADYERQKGRLMVELNKAESRRDAVLEAVTSRHLGLHAADYAFDPTKRAFVRTRR